VVSDPEVIRNNLVQQLYKPVLWSASVQKIADRGITKFYECGPGKVLAGLNKRIINQVSVATMESELAFEK
ncbi:MAG: malonyl CoA-acyl carrier protein transacylase, partial [Endozoicomonadaceae bacterium]|nr:malonyl CoA-acyl carrier protein transacylase [Endozoicomonadaceae bacterium]